MAPATDTAPDGGARAPRSLWRLSALLYPFVAAAMAINLFLLGLMGQAAGLPSLTPTAALALGALTGFPATWLAARWVRRLIEAAE
jgi:hypothetical protein